MSFSRPLKGVYSQRDLPLFIVRLTAWSCFRSKVPLPFSPGCAPRKVLTLHSLTQGGEQLGPTSRRESVHVSPAVQELSPLSVSLGRPVGTRDCSLHSLSCALILWFYFGQAVSALAVGRELSVGACVPFTPACSQLPPFWP